MSDDTPSVDEPSLDDALDGLQTAAQYCDAQDYRALDYIIGHLYQVLGARGTDDASGASIDEQFPAAMRLTFNDTEYTGDVTIEPWTQTAVNTSFTNDLDTDLGTVLEFWNANDTLNGDLVFDITQTRTLIESLLHALDDQLRIQYNRMELIEKGENGDFVALDELDNTDE